MRGQNDKVHLKNFKLFRIIPKKKLIFFKNLGGRGCTKAPLGPTNHLPLINPSSMHDACSMCVSRCFPLLENVASLRISLPKCSIFFLVEKIWVKEAYL